MSLFNQILGAVTNPSQQGSTNQIGNILDTVQQLSSNHQSDSGAVGSAISIVGNYVRGALQDKRNNEGDAVAEGIVNQFGGTNPNNQVVEMLFSAPQLQQLISEIEAKTGINGATIQSMLPTLVPVVLNFLQTGADTNNAGGGNSVLNAFLDADGDGDVDMFDAMQLASRHIGR
ncbi:MAG TPA: hypothetical protein DEG17_15275 [Cyanobacteria bacterium UBA11149]|nr:hypothetical protein [Cyanobacteria bacterium UBA11367]HBE61027.1 hypothetical protein [Cyanobacteria bacterium UBA11366]HBK65753.1 hypothetical protein [Cyanobacteria bacterium UBA11166]HBR72682.1 hypothetical protein [Cyanobacteria bacterium UBA11159]HBS69959.1 hypothetical protein [Cyanobacteria bacterium UBA11153]HBW90195.1 hypothetical protein [Cyanobacteria bacterium UBA11149]HCA95241.1 hypothetical protein [Cyanobacteria bacterium UBA9226]